MTETMHQIRLADRVSALKPSVTVAVTNRAKELRRQGADVLGFAAGEPDFDTPDRIKQAAIKALEAGQTKYMPTLGDPETRGVIADKLVSENGIQGLTPDHIAIGAGGKHVLFTVCHCLFDKPAPDGTAAEAVLPVPAWVSYDPIIRLAGGTVVPVETTADSNFLMTPAQLASAITPKTRAVFLNSPSNPCGTMYSPEQIRELAAVIAEKVSIAPDLVVVSDEIYEKIVYGGIDHLSIGAVPEIAERVVTLNGLSKAFAMTGWRVGYAACPGDFGERIIKAMGTLQGQMTTNITSFVYPAIRTALTECADDVDRMRRTFGERAELITKLIAGMDGLSCPKPTGAFYAFPDISAHFAKTTPGGRRLDDALSFCEALLDEAEVALVPGDDFGGCGKRHVRISFACSEEQIEAGMSRLGNWLSSLR